MPPCFVEVASSAITAPRICCLPPLKRRILGGQIASLHRCAPTPLFRRWSPRGPGHGHDDAARGTGALLVQRLHRRVAHYGGTIGFLRFLIEVVEGARVRALSPRAIYRRLISRSSRLLHGAVRMEGRKVDGEELHPNRLRESRISSSACSGCSGAPARPQYLVRFQSVDQRTKRHSE